MDKTLTKYVLTKHVIAYNPGATYRSARIEAVPHYETIPAKEVIDVAADDGKTSKHPDTIEFIWRSKRYLLERDQFVHACAALDRE